MILHCDYKLTFWNDNQEYFYTCIVTSSMIIEPNTRVTAFSGNHLPSKQDKDVEALMFDNTVVEYFPQGVHKIFRGLKAIHIGSCGLKMISKDDFKGLQKELVTLSITSNYLELLPANLLTGMNRLKSLILFKNETKYIKSKMLKPILKNDMKVVHLGENLTIDAFYESSPRLESPKRVATIEDLMELIDSDCQMPKELSRGNWTSNLKKAFTTKVSIGFGKLLESGVGSDCSIIVGSKEFRVHKCILAIHSPNLAESFMMEAEGFETKSFTLQDVSVESVERFLRYLYTGELPADVDPVDFGALATKLSILDLKAVCEERMIKSIDESNMMRFLYYSKFYHADNIKAAVFVYIKESRPDIPLKLDLLHNPEKLQDIMESFK